MSDLTSEFHVKHHFVTAYSPWANGSVERVCRELLRACKAVCNVSGLESREWPAVVETVQSILNHALLKRLGPRDPNLPRVYRTPLELFTGNIPIRLLMRALPLWKYKTVSCDNEVLLRRLINIEETQGALTNMHKDVKQRADGNRKRRLAEHIKKTNIQQIKFTVGDFVLVRRAKNTGHKMTFMWVGPRRITASKSVWVYDVENLVTGARETVHSSRIFLYRARMDGKDVNPDLLKAVKHTEEVYKDAE